MNGEKRDENERIKKDKKKAREASLKRYHWIQTSSTLNKCLSWDSISRKNCLTVSTSFYWTLWENRLRSLIYFCTALNIEELVSLDTASVPKGKHMLLFSRSLSVVVIRSFHLSCTYNEDRPRGSVCYFQHDISKNVVCATSKASDQPAHTRSLIRAFASRLNILGVLSYWTNTITGDCPGSSESTHVKMPHCWKSHVTAQFILTTVLQRLHSKTCVKRPLKIHKTEIFMTIGSLMKVENIAKCSPL